VGGVRAGLVAVAVVAVSALGAVPSTASSGPVVVEGASFPDPASVQLSLVGCDALYERAPGALQPLVGRGPGDVPLGQRSLGFQTSVGNAAGALFTVSSMAETSVASLAVNATARSTGVAYAAYQGPSDAGSSRIWLGRSALVTPGGAWQSVSVTDRTYDWTHYDLSTGAPVPGEPDMTASAVVDDFVATQGGDGPGIYTIGFGCNGVPFSVDAFRLGATTYDLEGLSTSISASVSKARVDAGDRVTVTGTLSTSTGDPLGRSTMILESRTGSGAWEQVEVVTLRGATATATVTPEEDTSYRWRFVDRPLADGATSVPVDVAVRSETPSRTPSPEPTRTPTAKATPTPTPTPTVTVAPTETATPAETPSTTPTPTETPTAVSSSSTPEVATESPMSSEPTPGP
jgi:hypothetical protein